MTMDERHARYRELNKSTKAALCQLLRDSGLIGSVHPPETWTKEEVIHAIIDIEEDRAHAEKVVPTGEPFKGSTRRALGLGPTSVEEQPHGADATAPLDPGGSLPLRYCYTITRPAPHRPEGEFQMSWGTWDTEDGPVTTVHHAAKTAALHARVLHNYNGPMTVLMWPHRGDAEHYRAEPPASAYRLELTGVEAGRPATEHNPLHAACTVCHSPEKEVPGADDPGDSTG